MKLADNNELVSVDIIDSPLEIIVCTKYAEAIRIRASEVSLYGTAAAGIKSITLKPKDEVISAFYANKNDDMMLLTTKGYIKRMKIVDLEISKRGRASNPVIKRIKSNPHILVDAKRLTPNQYKENVDIRVIYNAGIDTLKAFDYKYNVGEAGKLSINDELGVPLRMTINPPINPDEMVSDDYLLDKTSSVNLFTIDDSGDETVIKAGKKTKDIIADLDALLAGEGEITETETSIIKKTSSSTVIKKKNPSKSEELPFTKVSLFGDDDNE